MLLYGYKEGVGKAFIGGIDVSGGGDGSMRTTVDKKNYYIAGISGVRPDARPLVTKVNRAGDVVWQKKFTGGRESKPSILGVDASDNVYIAMDEIVAKIDSSGTTSWVRSHNADANNDSDNGGAVDSSGNVYVMVRESGDYNVIAYDTNGTQTRQLKFDDTQEGIDVNSSGDLLIGVRDVGNGNVCNFFKYNSAGTLLWKKYIESGDVIGAADTVHWGTDGNIYAGCGANTSTSSYVMSMDADATTIRWIREIGTDTARDITTDADGNVYVTGTNPSNNQTTIFKYNNAGTLLWVRDLISSAGATSAASLAHDGRYLIYSGEHWVQGGRPVLVNQSLIRLPADGSGTGVYTIPSTISVDLTYQVSSVTDAAGPSASIQSPSLAIDNDPGHATITSSTTTEAETNTIEFNNVFVNLNTTYLGQA